MKKLFLLLLPFYCLSCTSSEVSVQNVDLKKTILEKNPVLNLDEASASQTLVTLVKCIGQSNDRYIFNLSRVKALQLGATDQEYDDVVEAVEYMNGFLDQAESEGATIVMGNYTPSNLSRPYSSIVTDGFVPDSNFVAQENGLKFNVDWLEGQKTGFFIDQRENRHLLEKYAGNKQVLNMFCYTGGFSFYAMRGGARSVHSVDVSTRAIELAKQNVALNFPGDRRHEAFAEEAFRFHNKYDLIILDPPAFAKHQNVLNNAIQGYKKLNRKGIEVVKPGGIIFPFSCSQVMTKELFRQTVFTAAANTGRKVRILHQLTQPADHPVSIYHPEGEYLKGLVLYVE